MFARSFEIGVVVLCTLEVEEEDLVVSGLMVRYTSEVDDLDDEISKADVEDSVADDVKEDAFSADETELLGENVLVDWLSSGSCGIGPVLEAVAGTSDEILANVQVAEDSLLVGVLESNEGSCDVPPSLGNVDSEEDTVLELEKVKSCSPEAALLVLANWVDCNSEMMAVVEVEENVVEMKSGLENEKESVKNTLVVSSLDDEVNERYDACAVPV